MKPVASVVDVFAVLIVMFLLVLLGMLPGFLGFPLLIVLFYIAKCKSICTIGVGRRGWW